MKPTYDEKQIGAVLTFCLVCHRHFFSTKPGPICIACRRRETR